jgi:hypothetical protein
MWENATQKQINFIQVLLKNGEYDLYMLARELKPSMFCKAEASDLIKHITENRLDVAKSIIVAKLSDHDCHASPEDGCEVCNLLTT